MTRVLALGILLVLVAGCLSPKTSAVDEPQSASPKSTPPGSSSPNLLPFITKGSVSNGAEPSILTDLGGKRVWVGDTSGVYYTEDNGTHWRTAATYLGDFGAAFGDGIALAQDESGRVYGAFLHDNRIDVARSLDGTAFNTVTYAAGVSGSADRPWIAAHANEVALFYFDAPAVAVGFYEHCAHSTDSGGTFTDRIPDSIIPGQGGKAFYDSQGRFYFSSDTGSLHRYSTCLGGSTTIPMVNPDGVNNMLQSDVAGTDLFMAASTHNAKDITLAGSHDGGPARLVIVSPPELKANTYATVSAWKDEVAVAWYGSTSSGDPSSGFSGDFDVYLAVVHDFWGAHTLTQYKLTDSPNHHGTICMGGVTCTGGRGLLDYFMVDHDIWGGIHVAYAQDSDGAGVKYVHIPPADSSSSTQPGGPTALFSATINGTLVSVDGSASNPGTLAFSWDWGDGATSEGTVSSHAYTDDGAYEITLKVTDDLGRVGTSSQGVIVSGTHHPAPPSTSTTTSTRTTTVGSTTSTKSSATSAAPSKPATKASPGIELWALALGIGAIAARRRR